MLLFSGVEFTEKNIVNRRLPHILGFALACLPGLVLSCSAQADGTGWYVGGGLGANLSATENFVRAGDNSVKTSDGSGFVGGINGGYSFANGWRPELAFDYHHATVDSVLVTVNNEQGTQSSSNYTSGSVSATTLMGNIWYDFRQSDGFLAVIYPYAGVGVGLANVNVSGENLSTFLGGGAGVANGSSTVFAYQLGLGANWDIVSNLTASVDIRYLLTTNLSIPIQGGNGDLSGIYRAPSFTVGLKYKFGGSES